MCAWLEQSFVYRRQEGCVLPRERNTCAFSCDACAAGAGDVTIAQTQLACLRQKRCHAWQLTSYGSGKRRSIHPAAAAARPHDNKLRRQLDACRTLTNTP